MSIPYDDERVIELAKHLRNAFEKKEMSVLTLKDSDGNSVGEFRYEKVSVSWHLAAHSILTRKKKTLEDLAPKAHKRI
jgi:hypothetical protein